MTPIVLDASAGVELALRTPVGRLVERSYHGAGLGYLPREPALIAGFSSVPQHHRWC